MKQDVYLPLKLLKNITATYPNAWNAVEAIREDSGTNGIPTWPDWCYIPMACAAIIVSNGADVENFSKEQFRDITAKACEIQALAPWRLSKEVYVIDQEIKDLLFEQADDTDIPSEILFRLPYQSFYVEVPDFYFLGGKIHGFFVTLEYDVDKKDAELRFTFLDSDANTYSFPIYITAGTLSESIEQSRKVALGNLKYFNYGSAEYAEALKGHKEIQKLLGQSLQLVLYILASNAEITDSPEQTTITKRGKTIKDKYSEIRKWDVGIRIGSAIRTQNKIREQGENKTDSGHQSPRPHMRRAHWHHFWTGPKAQPEERKLILKWLSPMAVAVGDDETPVVIHKVEI